MDAFVKAVVKYHKQYKGKIIVVKFGGEIYDDKAALADLLEQVSSLQILGARVVLVHGGAKQIDALYEKRGIKAIKIDGERQCDWDGLEASRDALALVNEDIVEQYKRIAGENNFEAEGRGAYQGDIIIARPKAPGLFTGEVVKVNTLSLKLGLEADPNRIYVIHPICSDGKGSVLNVNADYVASALAQSLGAKRLIMCTNTPGILDGEQRLLSQISPARIQELIRVGIIAGGMIPKVNALIDAVKHGVEGAVILNPASLQTELFTENGAGTLIMKGARTTLRTPAPIP